MIRRALRSTVFLYATLGGAVVAIVGDHLLVGGQRVRGPAQRPERDARVVQRLGDLFAQGGGGVVAVVSDHLLVSHQLVRGAAQCPERDSRVVQRLCDLFA